MPTKRTIRAYTNESTYQYAITRAKQLRISLSSYLDALIGADRGDPHYKFMLSPRPPTPAKGEDLDVS